jgi:hypothetical protein
MRALLALVLALSVATLVHADTPAGPAKPTAPAVAKPAPPEKPVAKMSRGELEAEVTALRAENKKVKADYEAALTKDRERTKRLQKEVGQPASELK